MKHFIFAAVMVFFLLFLSNFFSIGSSSVEKTYFYEDFESRSDGWVRTNGIVIFRRVQRIIAYEDKYAFKMTGIVNNGFSGRFEHKVVDCPVTPNIIFEFAYYFLSKKVTYIGYQIMFNDGKVGNYFSLFDDGWFINISNSYSVQYKKESTKYWHFHTVRIYEDYLKAFGRVPSNLQITSVSLIMGDPYYKTKFQTAYFDSIKIYQDNKNYPPNTPLRPSGPDRGRINTSYQYSISTLDPNDDQVRIYYQYENNSGVWSEWVDSGDAAIVELRWMKPGHYEVKARAQDSKGVNSSSWSEPLIVTITNETYPLTIRSPNGNELFYLGTNQTITWSSNQNINGKVKIELYRNNILVRKIDESTPNTGRYLWEIPPDLVAGTDYKIKISSVDPPFYSDFSNSSFVIAKMIDLDVSIDSKDIMISDWTPGVNDTIDLWAIINCKGTQSLNTKIYFYINDANQSSSEGNLINTSELHIVTPVTRCNASWRPINRGWYQLSVEIINHEQEESSQQNNVANATKIIRVGATDDDIVFIPPKETTRIRDGHTAQVNVSVICYDYLNNVDLRIRDLNNFSINVLTPPQNLIPNIPQIYYIEVIPSPLLNNLSSMQKDILVDAFGYSADTGEVWSSNAGCIVVEIYRPESLVTEVAVFTLLLGGILTFFSLIITETGKYKLFSFLSLVIPLFTRIRSEEVLENFVRGQIYGFIKTNPGVHYNNIKKSLDVGNGTLAHHLSILEKTGLIKSRLEGLRYRLFYPTEMKFPEIRKYMFSELQIMLLKIIGEKPGITQKEIVCMQDESQQTVSYNLKELEKVREIIAIKKKGKKLYYLVPNKQASIS